MSATSVTSTTPKPISRRDFASMKRVLIKVGTCVLQNEYGFVALGRIGHLVEQIATLMQSGKQVILVSSGAVAMGRHKLDGPHPSKNCNNPRAYAAAGQSALMGLYDTLFRTKNITSSQVLVTDSDFSNDKRRENLRFTINHLLELGAIPILNENDVISTRNTPLRDEENRIFWDNDSLAALVAAELSVDLLILLTDVKGLYTHMPTSGQKPEVIHTYIPNGNNFTIGEGSKVGRGGMQAKISAALGAVENNVKAVIIASGHNPFSITKIVNGEVVGTLFAKHVDKAEALSTKEIAFSAKNASRALLRLSSEERSKIILEISERLLANQDEILAANKLDLEDAKSSGIGHSMQARLKLTPEKLASLVDGLRQIALGVEPIGRVLNRTELAPGLVLEQTTVPIGLLLVIFESRPDVLPQVSALAIRSGNGLLLKGGKEATRSNKVLHRIIVDAIYDVSQGKVGRHTISLIESREAIDGLLNLDYIIDLVIPRGSSQLVRYIQHNTKIPVLGHSEGICHVYVDEKADMEKAVKVVVDAKTDYPAACNAMETLLLNKALLADGRAAKIVAALRNKNVILYGGPVAAKELGLTPATSLRAEYGDLMATIEVVKDVWEAINHINTYGSGHTESIVTEDEATAATFMKNVESACVFHNASTRFADGYRFGLGAEVGISTSKIHARGPVGISGLQTTKWLLVSDSGHTAAEFTKGEKKFTHKPLLVQSAL